MAKKAIFISMEMKKMCKKCKTEKSFGDFYADKTKKHEISSSCKKCVSAQRSAYYEKNKSKCQARHKNWVALNKEKMNLYQKQYRKDNREKASLYEKNRASSDIHFNLKRQLRSRLRTALKNNQKNGSAIKNLGCSIEELKQYLETKFQSGMTWENRGAWHLDHIVPLSVFDLTKEEQVKQACHYTNLQPLWAADNLKKSNKIEATNV